MRRRTPQNQITRRAAVFMLASAGARGGATPEVSKIWDEGAHNAFTDLIRYRGAWICVFREGGGHVSPDGKIRVLESRDGAQWRSAALLSSEADLRDPKVTITPAGDLMLTAASVVRGDTNGFETFAWTSRDGRNWGSPWPIGERDIWLWRVTWHKRRAYGVGYGGGLVRLYTSADGKHFDPLVQKLFDEGRPSEATLLFRRDDSALCLLRRDAHGADAMLGTARPPYTAWHWKNLGVSVGGPNLIALPGGRLIGGGRLYDSRVRTALFSLDANAGTLKELIGLPSGGDTSYPGLALDGGTLFVSYYSSHEGKTSIYLAKVRAADLP